MNTTKYKLTTFKNRFQTEGTLIEKTFEELYLAFTNKVKRTREKYTEYMRADKATQLTIKDVGGFIGGQTEGGRRVNGIKVTRQLLTLDIDTKWPNVFAYLERNVHFYCMVHSTHKHNPQENRFRLIAPLSREVNEDEYEALGRRIAYQIENTPYEILQGLFDETTFQAHRLMFFPSVSADGEYICELLNLDMTADVQAIIDVDKELDMYLDRNDIFEWYKPERVNDDQIGKTSLENKNPLKASGMVGAFNRTYTISQAIDIYLSDVYKQERNGRYTFLGGESHGGGMTLNNDTLFYSHHGTDPANLYYRSAFDLVRIHKFGKFDIGFTPEKIIEKGIIEKTESFTKMVEFCRTIPEVVANSDTNVALVRRLEQQQEYVKENFEKKEEETKKDDSTDEIADEFRDVQAELEAELEQMESDAKADAEVKESMEIAVEASKVEKEEPKKENSKAWLMRLDGLKSNLAKLDLILTNDEQIGKLFYYDTFRENICFLRKPYWHPKWVEGAALQDKDMAHIRVYLDKVYSIHGEKQIDDAVIVEADKIQKNRILEHFESLVWDGKKRIETCMNEWFKVPLNPFTRAALKHWLVGAVSRIYEAGAPMDLLLVIKGEQGIGKSLFLKKLATIDFKKAGDHLYSDTKIDFDKAKDSYEQLEGIWIYEWKELAGMNMSEQESIKAFVDKTEDKFRRSYGRRNVEIKRRVAFAGTTNDKTPLRDRSGNRRFLVMESPLAYRECYVNDATKFTQEYRDQLIAEAIHYYKEGFNIFEWSQDESLWWDKANEDNLVENDMTGSIQAYISMNRPKQWYSMSVDEMISYVKAYDFQNGRSLHPHFSSYEMERPSRVCTMEIWKVALGQRDVNINRFHRELILQSFESLGWEHGKVQKRFGMFGHQLPFEPKGGDPNELPF